MGRAFEYRKATKFARWDKMAKQFTRAGREIVIAVKAGGPDPEYNPGLRRAIQNAKGVSMPKDRIDAAIKRASSKEEKDYTEIVYEGMGPHGVAIVIETATDNPTRTVANVRSIFNKKGGSLGTSGMHDFLFSRKGVFKFKADNIDIEELELNLIDAGLENLEQEEEMIIAYSAFQDFGSLQKALEENGIEVTTAELQRIPTIFKELSEEHTDEILDLIDRLEQDDDVQTVYHNLA
ncbi:MAG: YebC/PmpR family DNA-binding transcriptional regulator [Chitinophagales bacterium]|nr:YebC/PmpR family DNA-binding transcriptional regulator [Chitinophagales bacterium]MCZ2393323.1 YebC/PmpR family DNA-binding transcriptional regulator [Chitinophagales bacterium]